MNRTNHTARSVALRALLQMEKYDGYSNVVLDHMLCSSGLSKRDRALASTLFYGVLERQLTLDYWIRQCLREPQKKLDPSAMAALRCGTYQIMFLDRVPDSAAVNETVNAWKLVGKERLSGFVNGVLRGLLRRKAGLTLPEGDDIPALSLRFSVPEGLIQLWQHSYGKGMTLQLLESFSSHPELYIRVNRLKGSVEELQKQLAKKDVKMIPLLDMAGAAVLHHCGSPSELPEFKDGWFHVQDLSAQIICKVLDPQPGERICDCCAAPGGKSFTIAQEVGYNGTVYAFDLYDSRVKLIADGAKRLGLSNIISGIHDAAQSFDSMPLVDRMLCDVPCSGFGVIRRKPEIRYRSLDQIKELPELQYRILRRAAEKVRPGGVLVYSTCTLNPAENAGVAERFLQENSGFEPMNIENIAERCVEEPEHMLTMTPFSGGSDGFFAAKFRKKENRG